MCAIIGEPQEVRPEPLALDGLVSLWQDPIVSHLIAAAAVIALIILLVSALRRVVRRTIKDVDARYRTQKAVVFFGYFVALLYFIVTLSGRMSGLTVALGAASAGITFALQEVIVSIAGWVALSVGSFYKVGDRVQLGGIRGDVIDIGVLRTTLMECGGWINGDLYNGRIVRLANSFVFKEPVFNYSADFSFLWDEIMLPVRFGSDYEETRRVLYEIAENVVGEFTRAAVDSWKHMVQTFRIENARVEPTVTLVANDNWVEFTLRYVVDYKQRRTTKDALFTRILAAVDASDGKIKLASATFEVVAVPAIDVRAAPGTASIAIKS